MSNFFSSMADKAQSALNSSPLAQHLPPSLTGQSGENAQGGGMAGITKSHAFESIHHQIRTFQQQYSNSVSPLQRIVTSQKGVAIDFDSVSRDSHAHSKELYMWSQREDDDIKDVADRLAWINYVEGSLANTLATKINASRAPFKALRDAEANLTGRRNIRVGFRNQIARLEHEQQRANEPKIVELKKQLQKAELDDDPIEKEFSLLKRKAIRDSEQLKWEAMREYAEKLLLLSQTASTIFPVLPAIPPSEQQPYTGAETTATMRASLQHALDNYKTGDTNLPLQLPFAGDLSRSDTRSFGETHAHELSRINSADRASTVGIPLTPPPTAGGSPPQAPSHTSNISSRSSRTTPPSPYQASPPPPGTQSPPLNPAVLNQAPAPIPINAKTQTPVVTPNPTDPSLKIPSVTPTVAETGLPKSAGTDGPGPASGSLRDLKQSPPVISQQDTKGPYGVDLPEYGAPGAGFESGEEEKKRLQREEREHVLVGGSSSAVSPHGSVPGQFESAEDEKKRLEREERERVLAAGTSGGGSGSAPPPPDPEDDSELPPYQEF
ncbi:Eisosome component PIL1-domain-containing protein [Amylocystis lapponica]|nr:Eisosome component PIL1-domain-containing protein [Amylocystis lapponica]